MKYISRSASLSLNTPSVEASSRRAGLRRKTQRQTKFSAEDFIAAVHQRQLAGGHGERDGLGGKQGASAGYGEVCLVLGS